MRQIPDVERRARLAVRHAVAPYARVSGPVAATRAMTVLHATEAPSVHLAVHARVGEATVEDVDQALYGDRSLVKQLAMRRTLFVFPRDLLPAAWGSASARVAGAEAVRLAKAVEHGGLAADGELWVKEAREAVLARLADGSALTAQQLRAELPELGGRVEYSPDKKWGGSVAMGPRVLTLLGAEGQLVRGHNTGHWRHWRPEWTLMRTWLGETPAALEPDAGYAELVRRWLRTFGPGTETDIVWWLGATKGAVRAALAAVAAVEVGLEGREGATGWVLPDDVDAVEPTEPWAALLPVLDPTVMGWKERGFYLAEEHVPYLFDTNGNAGTTAWWDGRIVGCWVQDPDAVVKVVLREDVGSDGRAALDREAERLTAWLNGVTITSVYSSAQMKSERLP